MKKKRSERPRLIEPSAVPNIWAITVPPNYRLRVRYVDDYWIQFEFRKELS